MKETIQAVQLTRKPVFDSSILITSEMHLEPNQTSKTEL